MGWIMECNTYIPKCDHDRTPMAYDHVQALWVCSQCGAIKYLPIPKCPKCKAPMQMTNPNLRGWEVWQCPCPECKTISRFHVDAIKLRNLEREERQ